MDEIHPFSQHPTQQKDKSLLATQSGTVAHLSNNVATLRQVSAKKQRLDQLLVMRGLAETSDQALRLIMAGDVLVNEVVSDKPGRLVAMDAVLRVRALPQYVSRGGHKLAAALDEFALAVVGRTALDVGASTGGFSDCLLQRGVASLFAVDVSYGELAWKVRSDPRVTVLERTNIRHLQHLPGNVKADLAVIDASFISLRLVLPATLPLLTAQADIVALIKPQFEAEQSQVGQGGVVRSEAVHRQVLEDVFVLCQLQQLTLCDLTVSPLLGPAGNVEFLVWLAKETQQELAETAPQEEIQRQAMIAQTLTRAAQLRANTNK